MRDLEIMQSVKKPNMATYIIQAPYYIVNVTFSTLIRCQN